MSRIVRLRVPVLLVLAPEMFLIASARGGFLLHSRIFAGHVTIPRAIPV